MSERDAWPDVGTGRHIYDAGGGQTETPTGRLRFVEKPKPDMFGSVKILQQEWAIAAYGRWNRREWRDVPFEESP